MHQGAAFDEHLAYAGVHRRPSPGPPNYGRRLPGSWAISSGGLVVAKSALFRTPKHGHPSCRSLAPPLPTEPASLGFGGDPLSLPARALGPLCAKFGGSCAEITPRTPAEPGRLGYLQAPFLKPIQKNKTRWERRRVSLPPGSFITGAEAKQSFAGSSLPSLLLRKRVVL